MNRAAISLETVLHVDVAVLVVLPSAPGVSLRQLTRHKPSTVSDFGGDLVYNKYFQVFGMQRLPERIDFETSRVDRSSS